jgi:GH24 family phage-related lysozyme (muramidase)
LRLYWYPDSLGKKTGGYGHLWKPGDPSSFTQEQAVKWLNEDLRVARIAATKQFDQLPLQTQSLYDVLVSINYQLGTGWWREHKKTWAYLVSGDYESAIREAQNSSWFIQTPTRVKDLQKALHEAILLARQYSDLGL